MYQLFVKLSDFLYQALFEKNIFNSVTNINLRTVIGYHKDDMAYHFLDDYDSRW